MPEETASRVGSDQYTNRGRLRDAIADLLARHGGLRPDPPESRLARVASAMAGNDDRQRKDGKDYNLIAGLLAGELRGNDAIPLRHARDGAWCLWETEPAIGKFAPLLDRYLEQLESLKDKRASRTLCNAYLVQYSHDLPGLARVSQALEGLSIHAGEPYARLQHHLKLFSLREGQRRLGARALEQRQSPIAILQSLGLESAQLLQGGFVEPCARVALELAAADGSLKPRERLEFVKVLAVDQADRKLFFPQHKVPFAEALLLPYANKEPPEDVKIETLNLVTRLLGDPRTNPWVNMDAAKAVILRWLTRLALRQFLDVVEAINPDPNWRYRRKFWEAMYEHQAIGNAWTVLSSVGIAEAKRRFGTSSPYGRFVSGQVAPDHAVLLMEVGHGICAEWSYNGKCRFWTDRSRPGAPQMFRNSYDADFLRSGKAYAPVDEITHWPHKNSSTREKTAWQHKVAKRVHIMSGVQVPERDYM